VTEPTLEALRQRYAIDFAEKMCVLQDMPSLRACRLAAAAHDLDADALLVAWIRQLLSAGAPVLDRGAEAAQS
jgi:hypothetical protein